MDGHSFSSSAGQEIRPINRLCFRVCKLDVVILRHCHFNCM